MLRLFKPEAPFLYFGLRYIIDDKTVVNGYMNDDILFQTPNIIEYKPDPIVAATKKHLDGYVKHFTEQIGLYGQQVINH